jgi:hypothetical protein
MKKYLCLLLLIANTVFAKAQLNDLRFSTICELEKLATNARTTETKNEVAYLPLTTRLKNHNVVMKSYMVAFVAKTEGAYGLGDFNIMPLDGDCTNQSIQGIESHVYPKLKDGAYPLNFEKAIVVGQVFFTKNQLLIYPILIDDYAKYSTDKAATVLKTKAFQDKIKATAQKQIDEAPLTQKEYQTMVNSYRAQKAISAVWGNSMAEGWEEHQANFGVNTEKFTYDAVVVRHDYKDRYIVQVYNNRFLKMTINVKVKDGKAEAYRYQFYDFWWKKAIKDNGMKQKAILPKLTQFLEHEQVKQSLK